MLFVVKLPGDIVHWTSGMENVHISENTELFPSRFDCICNGSRHGTLQGANSTVVWTVNSFFFTVLQRFKGLSMFHVIIHAYLFDLIHSCLNSFLFIDEEPVLN